MTQHAPPILVFDTDCVLCSRSVHFILRHEAAPTIVFASAWGERGMAAAQTHGISPQTLNDTVLFVENGRALTRSDAAVAVAAHLQAPFRWLWVLRFVPRPLRNWVYGWIARNRYRWFGQRNQCFAPPFGQRHRFDESVD